MARTRMSDTAADRCVVVTEPIAESGLEDLRRHFEVAYLPGLDEARAAASLARASGVLVRTSPIDGDLLERLPAVQVIVKHGAGVDNIDIDAATRRGIAVLSTPGVGAVAVAEHAVMLILMTCRRAVELDAAVRSGAFEVRDEWRLTELHGKRVGIVGFGNIGRRVATICGRGFGAEMMAYDPKVALNETGHTDDVVMAASLEELLENADVVTVHAALTAESRHLIGEREIGRMKPTAILVNTSRGGLIDEVALARALQNGRLRGAGLDVFEQEPPDGGNELLRLRSVVCSPHIGGLTAEAADRLSRAAAAALIASLHGDELPAGLVNPSYLTHRLAGEG